MFAAACGLFGLISLSWFVWQKVGEQPPSALDGEYFIVSVSNYPMAVGIALLVIAALMLYASGTLARLLSRA
jgi:hypothetical protein